MKSTIEDRLKKQYPSEEREEQIYFCNSHGTWFHLVQMGEKEPWNFFVIEYMDTFEDGDGHYPDDYNNLDTMIADMIKEIEIE